MWLSWTFLLSLGLLENKRMRIPGGNQTHRLRIRSPIHYPLHHLTQDYINYYPIVCYTLFANMTNRGTKLFLRRIKYCWRKRGERVAVHCSLFAVNFSAANDFFVDEKVLCVLWQDHYSDANPAYGVRRKTCLQNIVNAFYRLFTVRRFFVILPVFRCCSRIVYNGLNQRSLVIFLLCAKVKHLIVVDFRPVTEFVGLFILWWCLVMNNCPSFEMICCFIYGITWKSFWFSNFVILFMRLLEYFFGLVI